MGIRKTLAGLVTTITLFSLNGTVSAASISLIGAVTIKDLTVDSPAIVPTNPLYFLTRWSWSVKRIFSPNKVLFNFDLVNRQAAEILELYEVAPDQTAVLVHSLTDYRNSLFEAVSALKRVKPADLENGAIKDADAYLDTIAGDLITHLQLVDELQVRTSASGGQAALIEIENQLIDAVTYFATSLDTPVAFTQRLQILADTNSSEFKSLRLAESIAPVIAQLNSMSGLTRPLPLLRALSAFTDQAYDSFAADLEKAYRQDPADGKATLENLAHLAGGKEARMITVNALASRISNPALKTALLTLLTGQ